MSRIRSKDTKPEIIVRKTLYQLGFRYRLHKKDLPGKPDIVLRKYKTAIFVNGCFWHRHDNCNEASRPKTNSAFWEKKLDANVERDMQNQNALRETGWSVIVYWECEVEGNSDETKSLIAKRLNDEIS